MRHKTYMTVTTWIFLVVGLLHFWRAFKGYTLIVGNLHVAPVWSWVGAAVALYLAYQGYKHSR